MIKFGLFLLLYSFTKIIRILAAATVLLVAALAVCKAAGARHWRLNLVVFSIVPLASLMGYSKIFRATGGHTTSRVILKNLFAMLPQQEFLRIHRSYVVSKSKVRSFNKQEVVLSNGTILPVGRQYAPALLASLSQ